MIFKVKDRVIDINKESILFVFNNTEERIQLINNLIKMEDNCNKFLMYTHGSITEKESDKILKDEDK